MVSVTIGEQEKIYRVQKLDSGSNRIMLRNHLAATLDNKQQEINKSCTTLLRDFSMKRIQVNAIGKRLDDQTNH
jgi:hypothetical protein